MEVVRTKLDGVLLLKPEIHEDFRGTIVSLYNDRDYRAAGITVDFVEDKIAVSSKHVLRGIHGDPDTWKLISCLTGRVYLVVVNCDESSPAFGKWQSFTLTDANAYQVLVPPKFGNGHVVLSDRAVFYYKWSAYYDLAKQFSYRFDDPKFKIWWPVTNPILSSRDDLGRYVE